MYTNPSTLNMLLRRVAAFFYDSLLLIALYFVITAAVVPLNNGEAIEHWSYKIFLILISFLFFDWFWRHGGQTLGMRAWRIRVEGVSSERIDFKQSAHRFITGLLAFGITFLFMFQGKEKQALHDRISKTKIALHYN